MRTSATSLLLLSLFVFGRGWSAENDPATAPQVPMFKLPPAEDQPEGAKFSQSELAYVQSWIRQLSPEFPVVDSGSVAQKFLEELQQRRPDLLRQLLTPEFPSGKYASMLLRQVGLKLSGPTQGALREEIAQRRVGVLLVAGGQDKKTAEVGAAGLIKKIRENSPVQYRRLMEGRVEDEDLESLLRKAGQPELVKKDPVPEKPKVLSAADIVSEFSRRNQSGAALQKLQAYVVTGRLKSAEKEEMEILYFKMRPNLFRLVVRVGGITRYILANDGQRFWQQAPGKPAMIITPEAMGQRRYLAEFMDPLFAGGGYVYERLADGEMNEKKIYRISVRRTDGSGYVACLDQENYRELARENEDKSVTRYSDFREIGGVTYAFREESADASGQKGVLELSRITPNAGLIRAFFVPSSDKDPGYFALEKILATAEAMPANKIN